MVCFKVRSSSLYASDTVVGYLSCPLKHPFLVLSVDLHVFFVGSHKKNRQKTLFLFFTSSIDASWTGYPKICGETKMCSPPIISRIFIFPLKHTKTQSSDFFCYFLRLKIPKFVYVTIKQYLISRLLLPWFSSIYSITTAHRFFI